MTKSVRRPAPGAIALCAAAALGSAVLLGGVIAAPASGAIRIIRTDQQATLLGKIRKGACHVRGRGANRHFRVSARSTNRDYELSLTILNWRGYGRQYNFRRGKNDPGVFYLRGPGAIYSNIFAPPGTTGHPAGGVALGPGRGKLSAGFLPTPSANFKKGVVLAGTMRCVR